MIKSAVRLKYAMLGASIAIGSAGFATAQQDAERPAMRPKSRARSHNIP